MLDHPMISSHAQGTGINTERKSSSSHLSLIDDNGASQLQTSWACGTSLSQIIANSHCCRIHNVREMSVSKKARVFSDEPK